MSDAHEAVEIAWDIIRDLRKKNEELEVENTKLRETAEKLVALYAIAGPLGEFLTNAKELLNGETDNFITAHVTDGDKNYILTLQRWYGLTPAEVIGSLKKEIAALKAQISG